MRIAIIGNLASGKSSLALALSKSLGITFLSLDAYREEFASQATYKSDRTAKKVFIDHVKSIKSYVVETIPFGYTYMAIEKEILKADWIIKMYCEPQQCILNHQNRKGKLPLPFQLNEYDSVFHIHENLKKIDAHLGIKFPCNLDSVVKKIEAYVKESTL